MTAEVAPESERESGQLSRQMFDSVAFDKVYDKEAKAIPEPETVAADSAYKTPHICKKVFRQAGFIRRL